MLHFHYCQRFKTAILVKSFKEVLLNKITEFSELEDLTDYDSIINHDLIYILKFSKNVHVLIQKHELKSSDNIYFVRDIFEKEAGFKIEKDYLEWLMIYPLDDRDIQNAIESLAHNLWQNKSFEKLLLLEKYPTTDATSLRIAIAELEQGEKLFALLPDLYKCRHCFSQLINDTIWKDELLSFFLNLSKEDLKDDQIDYFASIIFELGDFDSNFFEIAGNLYFKRGYNFQGIIAFNKINLINENYCTAKISLAKVQHSIEEEIYWLYKLLKYNSSNPFARSDIFSLFEGNHNLEFKDITNYFIILNLSCTQYNFLVEERTFDTIKRIEEKFTTNHIASLINEYYTILQNEELNSTISIFVLERWAKLSYQNPYKTSTYLEELNLQYKEIAENQKIIYQVFTETELEEMPDFPDSIEKNPGNHLKTITIKNFRRFDEINLSKLGQFNLIVGDNNSGKTSLLEALLFTHDKAEFSKNLAFCYAERINSNNFKEICENYENFGSDFCLDKEELLLFTLQENRDSWEYNFSASDFIPSDFDFSIISKLNYKVGITTPFVPFGKGFRRDFKNVFDEKISPFKILRKEFIENMKVFIPNIESITGADGGGIGIEETDKDNSSPLHQFGEGANKLFRILMQMTFQKDKRIMIDEIDSGIHFTHFAEFWKVILKVAHKNNIQVFATTHNLECIEAYKEVLEEKDTDFDFTTLQEKSKVIGLRTHSNKQTKAYTYSFDEFGYAIEQGSNIYRGGNL